MRLPQTFGATLRFSFHVRHSLSLPFLCHNVPELYANTALLREENYEKREGEAKDQVETESFFFFF